MLMALTLRMVVGTKMTIPNSMLYLCQDSFKNNKQMRQSNRYVLSAFVILLIAGFTSSLLACTTAVISGKYTKDGRPILYKHRDTWAVNNVVRYVDAEPYSFMGLVNSSDTNSKSVWIGQNESGFAIMNSASYNLNYGDTTKLTGGEGRLMRFALQHCKSVADFEHILDTLSRPTRLEANYGVIDAEGNACYYELGNNEYTKFDANDPSVAPYGYIIRTNFSFMGEMGKSASGYIRYETANDIFHEAIFAKKMDAVYLLQHTSKGLKHSLTNEDLLVDLGDKPEDTPTYHHFRDFIPRTGTSSAVAIEGVLKGESPMATTFYGIIGFPLTSVIVPMWLGAEDNLPRVVSYDETIKDSPICHAALDFKEDCLPLFISREKYYINVNALVNSDNTGIMQVLKPVEKEILKKSQSTFEALINSDFDKAVLLDYYGWIDETLKSYYQEELDYELF